MVCFELAVRGAVEGMSSLGRKSLIDMSVILSRKINFLHLVKRSLGRPALITRVDLPRRSLGLMVDNQRILEVVVVLGEASRLLADHKLLVLRLISCMRKKILVRL